MARSRLYYLLLFGLALNLLLAFNSYAADEESTRVIEEELVLKDPTVAPENKWAVGGSYDYWYISGPYNVYNGSTKVAKGTINGDMNGGSIFAGYDKFTFQVTTREGSWDVDERYISNPVNTTDHQKQREIELTARYLLPKAGIVNPYVIAGYNDISVKSTNTIKTAGWVWSYNSKTVSTHDRTYRSGLAGIGLILPVNKSLGFRGDGRLMLTSADDKRDDGVKFTGGGVGFAGTLTGYWNIYKGINLQAGAKYLYLAGGDAGWYTKLGYFGSLGYSYKF